MLMLSPLVLGMRLRWQPPMSGVGWSIAACREPLREARRGREDDDVRGVGSEDGCGQGHGHGQGHVATVSGRARAERLAPGRGWEGVDIGAADVRGQGCAAGGFRAHGIVVERVVVAVVRFE